MPLLKTCLSTNISPGPDDESGQTVTLSATSSNPPIIPNPTFSGSGATRTLTYTPVANANGSAIITVTANDGQSQNNTFSRTLTITVTAVNDSPAITVNSPNGGEIWAGGSSHDITWSASDVDGDTLNVNLFYTIDGINFSSIVTGLSNTSPYTWNPIASLDSSTVKIKATATDLDSPIGTDLSNANFTIDSTAPSSASLSINSGAVYTSNSDVTLSISATDNLSGVSQMRLSNGGAYSTWQTYLETPTPWTLSGSGDGIKNVYVEFKDNAGNYNTTNLASAQIILDTTPPVIEAHDDITGIEATSPSGATVTYTAPNVTDNFDAPAPASCAPASGLIFALGDTFVDCTKTDTAGNSADQTTFTVTVQDTTPPVINLNEDTPDVEINSDYIELGATATDAVDGLFEAIPSGFVDTTTVGSYTITYDAMDGAGNFATQITRTVRVVDTIATIFDGISDTLALLGIANNLNEVTSETIGSFFGLFFEKSVLTGEIMTKIGGITFNAPLDLSSELTRIFLETLGTYMEANPGSMKFDATTEEQLKTAGAEIKMYGLNDLGYFDVPAIIVKDDFGNIISPDDLNNYPSLTGQLYSVGDGGTLTFSTSHFTQFELPDSADVADVAADKEALVADSIKGNNPDLSNITVALAVLALSGSNGSTITWVSNNSDIVSNDGQTVNRPANGEGYATIVLTATFTKGLATDTKEFTLNVIELPPPPSAPVLHEVSSPTKDTTPTLSWDAVTADPAITSYEIEIYDSNEDNIYPDTTITTTEANFTLDDVLSEDDYTWYVRSHNSIGSSDWSEGGSFTIDTTLPTVTQLGDGLTDYQLPSTSEGSVAYNRGDYYADQLTFSEELSSSAKTAVENALTAGASVTPRAFMWNSNRLRIYATEETTFANDVVVSVSDLAGNTATLKLVDSALDTATQTAPDDSGSATADNTHREVVITDPDQEVNITIDSGTDNPTIDVSAFITDGTGTIPQITINSDSADVVIPATTVTGPTGWDGVIAAPTVTTIDLPVVSGETKTLGTAIEIGFATDKLSFDNAVRILLPGQAGKRVGYIRTGIDFTEITSTCSADNGDALVADGDCKIDVDPDLVIWTRHFTKFATYTQTTNSSSSSSSSSGGGDGGDGLGCAVNDCSIHPAIQNLVLGISTPTSAAGFAPGVLGVSTEIGNVGIGEAGEVQGEATISAQEVSSPTPQTTPSSSPFNIKVIAIIVILLLGGFGVFRFFIK